ncbi:MAG: hypothetical protein IPJ34_07920 [Myxococcales bacterium]|nr:hypothetical protein [Myxococcales bacterium]
MQAVPASRAASHTVADPTRRPTTRNTSPSASPRESGTCAPSGVSGRCGARSAPLTQRGFRVVHYSIQGNHVHLVVEVEGHRAFTTGLRALAAHVTHALHRVMGRGGRVLASRTHARALRTPTEVRNVLRYVLRNRTHHIPADVALDPFSTAPFFDDWASLDLHPPPPHTGRGRERADAPPRTWLLCGGYRPYRP